MQFLRIVKNELRLTLYSFLVLLKGNTLSNTDILKLNFKVKLTQKDNSVAFFPHARITFMLQNAQAAQRNMLRTPDSLHKSRTLRLVVSLKRSS